jgi:hypothetical protein
MGSCEIHRFRLGETMKSSVGPAAMISPAGLTIAKTACGESPYISGYPHAFEKRGWEQCLLIR